ncbi:PA2169 family four-helix-bundle protein [Iodidimonas sp. SYSU 1G8]|uniref:PA2169 family four-helix-bundle protein n=1 Tax=Iodidimonas sp. SYSU 1G8 TaxID=3133967 RepID=UPI0031FF01A1
MSRSDKVTVLSSAENKYPKGEDISSVSAEAGNLLHDLYVRARDSARGYRDAADDASDGSMKARFFGLARRRSAMAGQLELSLRSLGLDVAPDEGMSGAMNRHFTELKARLVNGDAKAVIAEVVRGETQFADAIEKALRQPLPATLRGALDRQKRQIQSAIDRFSGEISRESRLKAVKDKAMEYRKPALIALIAVGAAAVIGAAVVQQRRTGAVSTAMRNARKAIDRALEQLPSARQVASAAPSLPALSNASLPSLAATTAAATALIERLRPQPKPRFGDFFRRHR